MSEIRMERYQMPTLPDIREGEISLADLWFEIQQVRQAQGLPQKQLPYELDFRMH